VLVLAELVVHVLEDLPEGLLAIDLLLGHFTLPLLT
jgi:hypothetical protein